MAYGITGRAFCIKTDTHGNQFAVRSQKVGGEDAATWPCHSLIDTCQCDRLGDCAVHWWNGIRSSSMFDEGGSVYLPEANSRHLMIEDSAVDGSCFN